MSLARQSPPMETVVRVKQGWTHRKRVGSLENVASMRGCFYFHDHHRPPNSGVEAEMSAFSSWTVSQDDSRHPPIRRLWRVGRRYPRHCPRHCPGAADSALWRDHEGAGLIHLDHHPGRCRRCCCDDLYHDPESNGRNPSVDITAKTELEPSPAGRRAVTAKVETCPRRRGSRAERRAGIGQRQHQREICC